MYIIVLKKLCYRVLGLNFSRPRLLKRCCSFPRISLSCTHFALFSGYISYGKESRCTVYLYLTMNYLSDFAMQSRFYTTVSSRQYYYSSSLLVQKRQRLPILTSTNNRATSCHATATLNNRIFEDPSRYDGPQPQFSDKSRHKTVSIVR